MNSEEKRVIYCSGPLFCPEERYGMALVAETLEASGFDTFLPQRDGLEKIVMPLVRARRFQGGIFGKINLFVSKGIFCLDLFQIVERCHALVINMNGRVPDEGGVAEAAIAFTLGKPVILYKHDDRSAFCGHDNSMILGLSQDFTTVDDIKQIPVLLKRLLADTVFPAQDTLPETLKKRVEFGREIWSSLNKVRDNPSLTRKGNEILRLAARFGGRNI